MILNYVERVVSQTENLSPPQMDWALVMREEWDTHASALYNYIELYKHVQFLHLTIVVALMCSHSASFPLFRLALLELQGECRCISDRVTCGNDFEQDKKALTSMAWQVEVQKGRRKTRRRRHISTSTLLSLPAGSILALALLCLFFAVSRPGRKKK